MGITTIDSDLDQNVIDFKLVGGKAVITATINDFLLYDKDEFKRFLDDCFREDAPEAILSFAVPLAEPFDEMIEWDVDEAEREDGSVDISKQEKYLKIREALMDVVAKIDTLKFR